MITSKRDIALKEETIQKEYGIVFSRFMFGNFENNDFLYISVFLILMVIISIHIGAKILIATGQIVGMRTEYFGGSIHDTINASFAFTAFFIPFWVVLILVNSELDKHFTKSGRASKSIFMGILGTIIIFFYFSSALSATHPNTSLWEAFIMIDYSTVFIMIILFVVVSLIKRSQTEKE